jgi:hypothetical protein
LIRLADVARHARVRDDVAVRDAQEPSIDVLLEGGRRVGEVEREVELATLLGEVLLDLTDGLLQQLGPDFARIAGVPSRQRPELDAAYSPR